MAKRGITNKVLPSHAKRADSGKFAQTELRSFWTRDGKTNKLD